MEEDEVKGIFRREDLETVIGKLLGLLGDKEIEDIRLLTELDEEQVGAYCVLHSYAEALDFTPLLNFLRNFLYVNVSKNRKGRKEIVETSKSFISSITSEETSKWEKFLQNL